MSTPRDKDNLNPLMDKRRRATAAELGDEIFHLVQGAQGRGFVSDGVESIESRDRLFGVIRWHLKNTETAAKILRKWLRKYGQL